MKIDGSCYCGAITYEAELDPESVGICHCTDCQALSASAFRTIGVVQAGAFRLLKGNPKIYIKTGDSGNRREQAFCDNCGSGIYAASTDDDPKVRNISYGYSEPAFSIPATIPSLVPVCATLGTCDRHT